MKEKQETDIGLFTDRFYNNENLWCSVLLVLATVLSFFPILVLKDGGSWTFFSLLPLWLITYFFGFRTGLIGSFLFSICKLIATFISEGVLAGALADPAGSDMVRNSFIKGPVVFALEYPIACTAFCLGGLLASNLRCQRYISSIKASRIRELAIDSHNDEPDDEEDVKMSAILKKYEEFPLPIQIVGDIEKENTSGGLIFGYLIGVFVMFVCYVIAAPYYDAYPDSVTTGIARLIYDIKYDGSYLLAEALTTVLVLCIPAVREVLFKLKHIANNPKEDPTFKSY